MTQSALNLRLAPDQHHHNACFALEPPSCAILEHFHLRLTLPQHQIRQPPVSIFDVIPNRHGQDDTTCYSICAQHYIITSIFISALKEPFSDIPPKSRMPSHAQSNDSTFCTSGHASYLVWNKVPVPNMHESSCASVRWKNGGLTIPEN